MVDAEKRSSLLLLASEEEWAGRSLESVFELNGYSVLRCQNGRRALEMARRARPHALILDESLPEMSGIEVTRALHADPLFDQTTPIVITAAAPVATGLRREAYVAGAWEYCVHPLDMEVLLLKLAAFMRAKEHAEEVRARSLVDQLTGLFSSEGLEQWVRRLGALAARGHEPFACVALAPAMPDHTASNLHEFGAAEMLSHVAEVWRANSRRSDVMGHLDRGNLAILAPETDAAGASRIVERLRTALEQSVDISGEHPTAVLRAGYCAYDDFATAAMEPVEIVRRAERALDHAKSAPSRGPAVSFDQMS
jgi:PleD family two-component response regulator